MKYTIYTDGGSRGNPGPAGCGAVIVNEEKRTRENISIYLGITTNNVAEYTAVKLALARAIELGATEIALFADSELVIKQLTGIYRVKDPTLRILYQEILTIIGSWGGVISFTHIYREKNTEADHLANLAMDWGR